MTYLVTVDGIVIDANLVDPPFILNIFAPITKRPLISDTNDRREHCLKEESPVKYHK